MEDRLRVALAGLVLSVFLSTGTLAGQVTAGTDLTWRPDFVWRGLTRTNRVSLQPSVSLALERGSSLITVGGWASFEPAAPDSTQLSLVGAGGDELGEADLWVQWDLRFVKLATIDLSLGWTLYTYHGDVALGGRGRESNTNELYLRARLTNLRPIVTLLGLPPELPLGLELSAWKDLDAVGGIYGEFGLDAQLPVLPFGEPVESLILRAVSGWSWGQEARPGDLGYFDGSGPTHLALSLSTVLFFPVGAGGVTIAPGGHLQIGFDEATRRRGREPNDKSGVFTWTELTISFLYPVTRSP